jgi:two-component sensor histidine kinase
MALLHEKLYQSRDFSSIDFAGYLEEIAEYLFNIYVKNPKQVSLSVETSAVVLGMDEAIPCGLIINELVSNALKHAFPSGRKGRIDIHATSNEHGWVSFTVADDGIGLPGDIDILNTGSLGLQLVAMLTRQLLGKLEVRNEHGASFTVSFQGKQGKPDAVPAAKFRHGIDD